MSALRELIAVFGVEVDDKQLKAFERNIKNTTDSLKKLGAGLIAGFAVKEVAGFIESQISAVAALDDTAQRLGVTSDALQEFQFAAGQSGVSAEGAANGLNFLNKNLGEAIDAGGEPAQLFAKLGINLDEIKSGAKGAIDILPQLADKFAGAGTDAERTQLAMKIFGKAGTDLIPLLKGGAKGIDELRDKFNLLGGGLSKDTIAAMAQADDEIDATKFTFKALSAEVVAGILPAIRWLVSGAQKLIAGLRDLNAHTTILKSGAMALGAVLGFLAYQRIAAMLPQIWNAIKALRAMSTTFMGMNVSILGLVAVFALIFLAIDDLIGLMNGDESVIGEFLDKFMGVGAAADLAKQLNEAWDAVSKAFEDSGPAWQEIADALKSAGRDILPYLIQGFVGLVKIIGAAVTLVGAFIAALAQIPQAIKSGDFSAIGKTIDAAGNAVFGKSVSMVNAKTGEVTTENQGGLFGAAPTIGRPMAGFTREPTNVQQNNPVTINVQGVGDPQQVAKKVGDNVGKIQQDANQSALGAIRSGV